MLVPSAAHLYSLLWYRTHRVTTHAVLPPAVRASDLHKDGGPSKSFRINITSARTQGSRLTCPQIPFDDPLLQNTHHR